MLLILFLCLLLSASAQTPDPAAGAEPSGTRIEGVVTSATGASRWRARR